MLTNIIALKEVGERQISKDILLVAKLNCSQTLNKSQRLLKNTINTFSAIYPYQSPKYAISVLIDEPQGAPKLWGHSRNEAGWNSSYITGLIIKKLVQF